MKKQTCSTGSILKFLVSFLLAVAFLNVFSQVPQGINYQGVVRNGQGNIVANHVIGVKFNIHALSAGGSIVYSETHAPTSDQFGGITLIIGQGTPLTGTFAGINWPSGSYFSEVLIDVAGGSNYVSMGTTQLMSVPYALYAGSAGSVSSSTSYTIKINGVDIKDTSLNFAAIGPSGFITRYNYVFNTSNSGVLTYDIIDSIGFSDQVFTSDTIGQATLYSGTERGKIMKIGNPYGDIPNHNGQIYYVPLNAVPVTGVTLFYHQFGSWHFYPAGGGNIYQLLSNNPSVTGFNLPNTFTKKLER